MAGLLSVIVPVYNTAPYLERCLESILGQTYRDIEVILVDDGSTDGSELICKKYQNLDNRISFYENNHMGAMVARQTGGRVAKGKIITFVDSDDWLDLDMYEQMMKLMDEWKSDVVCTGHKEEFAERTESVKCSIPVGCYFGDQVLQKDVYSKMLYVPEIDWFGISANCWNKLFKRHTIYEVLMQTDERLRDGDDHAFVYPALLRADSIYISDILPYHHRRHLSNSLSTEFGDDVFENFGYLYSDMKHRLEKSGYLEVLEESFSKQMRWFLLKYIREKLHVDIYEKKIAVRPYLFPFGLVKKGETVVLWGAGNVGKVFYDQIKKTEYCKLVAWVDSNSDAEGILNPNALNRISFDRIVIAVLNKNVADEIKDRLNVMGIDSGKIIWTSPDMYCCP